jgi:hypothetical protein
MLCLHLLICFTLTNLNLYLVVMIISLKNSSRQDCNFEHIIVKWNSSSTPELHNLQILSSAGVFKYLTFSIFKLLLLCIVGVNKLYSLNQSKKQD